MRTTDATDVLPAPAGGAGVPVASPERGELAAPCEPAPAPPPLGALRRWLPVLVLGVMFLVLAAHAALSARSARDLAELRAELAARSDDDDADGRADAVLLDTIRDEIRVRSDADRVAILQELATTLDARGDEQATRTAERLIERLAQARAATAAVEAAAQPAAAAPVPTERSTQVTLSPTKPAPGISTPPAADGPAPGVVFVVDASSPAMARVMPKVFAELTRELERLNPREEVRLIVLEAGRAVETPTDLLPDLRGVRSAWGEFLLQANGPGTPAVLDHGRRGVADTIGLALRHAPDQLFILSDSLGGGGERGGKVDGRRNVRRMLLEANAGRATDVHVIHFFDRTARGDLAALAREQGGSYTFIPGP